MIRAVVRGLALGILLFPGRAGAEPTKQQCIDANGAGQDLRRDGKLKAAREKFVVCTAQSCPGPVRDDCGERLSELEKATPTIIFELGGHDAAPAIAVAMDGQQLAERVEETPLSVDPGNHEFTFTADGATVARKVLTIREGEKDRRERIAVAGRRETAKGAATPASEGASPIPAIVSFSVGGVGLILGVAFTVAAVAEKGKCTESKCDPGVIPADNKSTVEANTALAAVGWSVAALGAGFGVAFLVLMPSGKTSGAYFTPVVRLGFAGLEGRFQ